MTDERLRTSEKRNDYCSGANKMFEIPITLVPRIEINKNQKNKLA